MGGWVGGRIGLVQLFESGRMKKESIIFPFFTVKINGWCQKVNNQEVVIKESLIRYSEEIGKNKLKELKVKTAVFHNKP